MRIGPVILPVVALLIGPFAGIGASRGAAASSVPGQGEDTFLGFKAGDEVVYTLETEAGSSRVVTAQWSIRLEQIDRATEVGLFELSHVTSGVSRADREAAASGSAGLRSQAMAPILATTAQAWINAHGFPLRVRFTTKRLTSLGGLEYTVEYRFEDERYVKELDAENFRDQKVDLDDYRLIDVESPAGLYLFMPIDAECLGSARRAMAGGGGRGMGAGGGAAAGAGGPGGPVGSGDAEPPCKGRELVFANPGLLNLTMPTLWEAGTGRLEFMALAPTGVRASTLLGGTNSGTSGGSSPFTVGGIPVGAMLSGGLDPFDEARDALQMTSLESNNELLQLEVGGRNVDVWKLNASAPLESAYVDGNGSIVRLDLPPDPETGMRFWIRRLRPSEY